MISSLRAELLKLRKRRAVWVLVTLIPLLGFIFGYLVSYLLLDSQLLAEGGTSRAELLVELVPAAFVSNAIQGFPLFDFGLMLLLGGLAVGAEYAWGTVGATLVQRPGRAAVYTGQIIALAVVAAIATAAAFAMAAVSSVGVAASENAAVAWPSLGVILRGLGAGWLILTVAAVLGAVIATLLRSTSLAVGLGLVYVFVVEPLMVGFAGQSQVIEGIARTLPGANAGSLSAGIATEAGAARAPGLTTLVSPEQGALVLAGYLVGFAALGLFAFTRRDVEA